jgi:hypothetical protein
MSGLGRKYCSNRCRDLTKYYGVVAIPENVGRQVTYRLISPAHYVQVTPNTQHTTRVGTY